LLFLINEKVYLILFTVCANDNTVWSSRVHADFRIEKHRDEETLVVFKVTVELVFLKVFNTIMEGFIWIVLTHEIKVPHRALIKPKHILLLPWIQVVTALSPLLKCF
jgi:hypothetical protein